MRIAFFGLAYHARTGSSRFMQDLLAGHGAVDSFFAEPDVADVRRRCAGFDERDYDAIFVWQLQEAFALLSGRHPNVTFAPMYDAMFRGGAFAWKRRFSRAKILCFSWALRQEVMRRAPLHHRVQYFPEPRAAAHGTDRDALRGFFWYRRRDIPPARILSLTAGTRLERLTIHDAPDPGHEAALDLSKPEHVGTLVRTTWSEGREAFAAALAEANLFFASRPLEGIGMAFLEAMAAGLCVVAPDAPTMNEYISHGSNGLLYAPGREAPLDLSRARAIGARGRESAIEGRARWEAGLPAMLDFVLTPSPRAGATTRPVLAPSEPGIAALSPPHAEALAAARAEWVILLPQGDALLDAGAAQRLLDGVPDGVDVVCGHYLRSDADGSETLCRPAEIGAAWARLLAGEVGPDGPLGMPIPAATAFRRALLRRADVLPDGDAALCDLLLTLRETGARIHEAPVVVARRTAPPAAQLPAWVALLRRREG
ncbi:MAG: glycosyltransferase, partial [Acetobacteraceae bacterium]|nr:glycosyltransferase [Acetobacteraceae bacterium]